MGIFLPIHAVVSCLAKGPWKRSGGRRTSRRHRAAKPHPDIRLDGDGSLLRHHTTLDGQSLGAPQVSQASPQTRQRLARGLNPVLSGPVVAAARMDPLPTTDPTSSARPAFSVSLAETTDLSNPSIPPPYVDPSLPATMSSIATEDTRALDLQPVIGRSILPRHSISSRDSRAPAGPSSRLHLPWRAVPPACMGTNPTVIRAIVTPAPPASPLPEPALYERARKHIANGGFVLFIKEPDGSLTPALTRPTQSGGGREYTVRMRQDSPISISRPQLDSWEQSMDPNRRIKATPADKETIDCLVRRTWFPARTSGNIIDRPRPQYGAHYRQNGNARMSCAETAASLPGSTGADVPTDRVASVADAGRAEALARGEVCMICQELYEYGCGHLFCEECLVLWLQTNDGCPSCRAKVEGC